ncbi:MAG: SpoIIE family protein phosphatase [Phycisphaeraceae bacterium]|nr:SpoIIE family protein phosphatase [Phycisphaeraceae bacterium]
MAKHVLKVSRGREVQEIPLDRPKYRIGRENADILLRSKRVSRDHASLYRDPFRRWIIVDQNSRHGVYVNHEKVEVVTLSEGQQVHIGPFTLELALEQSELLTQGITSPSVQMTYHDDDVDMEARDTNSTRLGLLQFRQFNHITEELATASSVRALHQRACERLVTEESSFAAILRHVPGQEPTIIEIYCGPAVSRTPGENDNGAPMVSNRVVQAASMGQDAIKAGSVRSSSQTDLLLTVSDQENPRTVLCAVIARSNDSTDMLYLDAPRHHVSYQDLDLLTALARQIALLRKSLIYAEHRVDQLQTERELNMARDIQAQLVPATSFEIEACRFSLVYQPATWVGGDYCDHWVWPDGSIGFAVGDVSGKGLPAALVMSNVHATLRTATGMSPELESVMRSSNAHMIRFLPESMFVTMILGRFNPSTRLLEFVNAGHPLPLLRKADGAVGLVGKVTNTIMGIIDEPYVVQSTTLPPGSTCFFLTDGVHESVDRHGRMLGTDRVLDMLGKLSMNDDERSAQRLMKRLSIFIEKAPIQDDITIFAIDSL